MRRSIPPSCVARRLNSLLFALPASCHAGASTSENANLFLRESELLLWQALFGGFYYLRWKSLTPVIISHAVWSAFVFAVVPVP